MLGTIITYLLTPNNLAVPALAFVGAWIWHRLRGDKTAAWGDLVTGAVSTIAQEAITTWVPGGTVADGLAYVRDYVEKYIWSVLSKRNVPRNSLTERLVHAAVEMATSELANVVAQRLLPLQMASAADAANSVKSAFVVDDKSALAKVGRDLRSMADIEVVQPGVTEVK